MSAMLRLEWEADDDPDGRRRHLLAVSDGLLDEVEAIRLRDRRRVPQRLQEDIRSFQIDLGRPRPPVVPTTARAAHDLILNLQVRLLAANPRSDTPRSHHGRAAGQPVITIVQDSATWKVLALPPASACSDRGGWLELVAATVERAADRWEWAQHHARAAARMRRGSSDALAMAAAAWTNYWELHLEQERILARVAVQARAEAMALTA